MKIQRDGEVFLATFEPLSYTYAIPTPDDAQIVLSAINSYLADNAAYDETGQDSPSDVATAEAEVRQIVEALDSPRVACVPKVLEFTGSQLGWLGTCIERYQEACRESGLADDMLVAVFVKRATEDMIQKINHLTHVSQHAPNK